MILLPNLSILLLACDSRRAFLGATCGAATAIVAVPPMPSPAIAVVEDGATS
jgi:hypothetical protein